MGGTPRASGRFANLDPGGAALDGRVAVHREGPRILFRDVECLDQLVGSQNRECLLTESVELARVLAMIDLASEGIEAREERLAVG